MASSTNTPAFYVCPMHPSAHQAAAGKCPKCGMALLPEGTRFGLLRHIVKSPRMLVIMLVAMLVLMAAFMMMR
jgi:hypothetical protein